MFGDALDQLLDQKIEGPSQCQIESQRQHGDGNNGPANTVAQAEHQHARADLASGPHPDCHRQPMSPVGLLAITEGREHLPEIAQQSNQQHVQREKE
jgi:hypothetical protein